MRARSWLALFAVALLGILGCNGVANNPDGPTTKKEAAAPKSVIQKHVVWKKGDNAKTIKPTAIVLHWSAGYSGGEDAIKAFIKSAEANKSIYNPKLRSTDSHPVVGHVTVQVAVMGNGKAYQLTPHLNSFARHAKCANKWAIGIEIEGFGPGHKHYIGKNETQFKGVVAVVKELMAKYDIKAENVVAEDGRSSRGIVSHKQVDAKCKWADGVYAGSGKEDVDDKYLNRVIAAVK